MFTVGFICAIIIGIGVQISVHQIKTKIENKLFGEKKVITTYTRKERKAS